MKSKIRNIIVIFIVLIIVAVATLSFMTSRGIWVSKGRCLIAKNNTYMVILNDRSPYCMSTNNVHMFDGLDNGDEILVLHGYFLDSYPGETSVYAVMKLKDGDISDISEEVLSELSEMGWIKLEAEVEENTEDVIEETST